MQVGFSVDFHGQIIGTVMLTAVVIGAPMARQSTMVASTRFPPQMAYTRRAENAEQIISVIGNATRHYVEFAHQPGLYTRSYSTPSPVA